MSNSIKISKQDIRRASTCNCGCGGTDPWHRREYKRTVSVGSEDALEGFVKLPMSEHPVRVTRPAEVARYKIPIWWIDSDSIVH